jgi:DNA-binding MarR family transcriptional regulator
MGYYDVDNFCPDSSIGYLVRRVHQLGLALLEPVYADEGITASQWSALATVYAGLAGTCAELAREIGHDKGAMTRLVDQLVARGLIERERDADDRRVVNLTLTPEGKAVTTRTKKRVLDQCNQWLGDWDKVEINRLLEGLARLRTKLETLEAQRTPK